MQQPVELEQVRSDFRVGMAELAQWSDSPTELPGSLHTYGSLAISLLGTLHFQDPELRTLVPVHDTALSFLVYASEHEFFNQYLEERTDSPYNPEERLGTFAVYVFVKRAQPSLADHLGIKRRTVVYDIQTVSDAIWGYNKEQEETWNGEKNPLKGMKETEKPISRSESLYKTILKAEGVELAEAMRKVTFSYIYKWDIKQPKPSLASFQQLGLHSSWDAAAEALTSKGIPVTRVEQYDKDGNVVVSRSSIAEKHSSRAIQILEEQGLLRENKAAI